MVTRIQTLNLHSPSCYSSTSKTLSHLVGAWKRYCIIPTTTHIQVSYAHLLHVPRSATEGNISIILRSPSFSQIIEENASSLQQVQVYMSHISLRGTIDWIILIVINNGFIQTCFLFAYSMTF